MVLRSPPLEIDEIETSLNTEAIKKDVLYSGNGHRTTRHGPEIYAKATTVKN